MVEMKLRLREEPAKMIEVTYLSLTEQLGYIDNGRDWDHLNLEQLLNGCDQYDMCLHELLYHLTDDLRFRQTMLFEQGRATTLEARPLDQYDPKMLKQVMLGPGWIAGLLKIVKVSPAVT